ncbi:hypothetical protein COOONC_26960, partial [Cooperia oncophora]
PRTWERPSPEVSVCFWAANRTILDARRSKHQVILGDFNATPGLRRNEERYIGNNSSGARNHRGQMLADFCEERKLFLANSFFKKRLDDRWTWRNDALGLKKEIDYVLLRSMKGVVDVGVLTSVNTGSDHRMLRCKIRLNPISQLRILSLTADT